MEIENSIEGVVFKPLQPFEDDRGWLAETFRSDEASVIPAMSYVSVTHGRMVRGPHEHLEQTDRFVFAGPGEFHVKLWDNRPESPTYGNAKTIMAGEKNPVILTVPPRIVHGYVNVSEHDAWVMNFPDRLFMGEDKKEKVDEVRYEGVEDGPFSMEE